MTDIESDISCFEENFDESTAFTQKQSENRLLDEMSTSRRWFHLGISTSNSPALRLLLKQGAPAPTFTHTVANPQNGNEIESVRNYLVAKNVFDTFLSYKWVLQRLLHSSSDKIDGFKFKIADVLLFAEGEPTDWIYTNQKGKIKSRDFPRSSTQHWEQFLKAARQASGVAKDDFSTPVCTRYSLSVEGVVGEHINVRQLRDFSRTDSVDRFQVIGLQICPRPKCGKLLWRKSIVYKTELRRDTMKRYCVEHTKEYEMFESVWDSHMSNHELEHGFVGSLQDKDSLVSLRSISTKKQIIISKSLNRPSLESFAFWILKNIEQGIELEMKTFRSHFILDIHDNVWLVGVSKVLPMHAKIGVPVTRTGEQQRKLSLPKELEPNFSAKVNIQDCLRALNTPVLERKSSLVQSIFDYTRGSHFVSNLPPGLYFRLCHSMEYKFVEKGLEVYYAGDPCDDMCIILSGSVRTLQEPLNSVYCRTVDLVDKDTFGEQAITRPGSKMESQVIATEDTHLIVVKRQAVDQVLDKGRSNPDRWKMKKPQLLKCRKVFCTDPRERTEVDVKIAVACTHCIYFFQNLSSRIHHELCSIAQYRRFEKHQTLFDRPLSDLKGSQKSSWAFYIMLSGQVHWEYFDRMNKPIHEDVTEGGHVLSVGICFSSDVPCEILIIHLCDWEKIVQDCPCARNAPAPEIESEEVKSHNDLGIFLTELEMTENVDNQLSINTRKDTLVVKRTSSKIQPNLMRERHITCAVTGDKFPASEQRLLRWRQIRNVAEHLAKRKAHVRGFDRELWGRDPHCRLRLLDMMVVSPFAYNVYVSEKNLEDQERIFALLVLNGSSPPVCQRVLPPSGCIKATSKLWLYAMFLEFVSIDHIESFSRIGAKFQLRFSMCEQTTQISFEIGQHNVDAAAQLPVNQIRVSWFFCSDEGINTYIKERNVIEFSVFDSSASTIVAKAAIDLASLGDKVALHQTFQAKINPTNEEISEQLSFQFAYLNLNFGCIRFREVDTSNFRLRRRHGLYLPSCPFITESLPPEGWDPCNEETIRKILLGDIDEYGPVLSMDGKLLPSWITQHDFFSEQGPAWSELEGAHGLDRFTSTHLIDPIHNTQTYSTRRKMQSSDIGPYQHAHYENKKSRPGAPCSIDRKQDERMDYVGLPDPADSHEGASHNKLVDVYSDISLQVADDSTIHMGKGLFPKLSYFEESESKSASTVLLERSRECVQIEAKQMPGRRLTGPNKWSEAQQVKVLARPSSAMSRLMHSEDEKHYSSLVATMSRPDSALERSVDRKLKCLVDNGSHTRLACQVSNIMSNHDGRNQKGKELFVDLDRAQAAWRSKLTGIETLDEDLRALDNRMFLVSLSENS